MAILRPGIRDNEVNEQALIRLARGDTGDPRLKARAIQVLACLDGESFSSVAKNFATSRNTVKLWFRRVLVEGIAGLQDRPRCGAPAKYPPQLRERLLRQLNQPPPCGCVRWDAASLGTALGVSTQAAGKVLRNEGVHFARKRTWSIGRDAAFAEKSAEVIGLYLSPWVQAVVFSVDDSASLAALEPVRGMARAGGARARADADADDYRRNVIRSLFTALARAQGPQTPKFPATKNGGDGLGFITAVVAAQADGKELHVVVHNLSPHKDSAAWLEAHPRVSLHFTPLRAAWLGQVEIWFNILARKVLSDARLRNLAELTEALRGYTASYAPSVPRVEWRKR